MHQQTRITDIRTLGVPVADQDLALAFHVDKLGFETRLDVPLGEGKRWYASTRSTSSKARTVRSA